MNLYLQPTLWSCVPTAFGMCIGATPKEMFEEIGHDGSEIIWPDLIDPDCRRAFHVQECVRVCLQNMYFPVEIEVDPHSAPMGEEVAAYRVDCSWFEDALKNISGVILGLDGNNRAHAVAWCRAEQMVFDPTGRKYGIDEFTPHTFYGIY